MTSRSLFEMTSMLSYLKARDNTSRKLKKERHPQEPQQDTITITPNWKKKNMRWVAVNSPQYSICTYMIAFRVSSLVLVIKKRWIKLVILRNCCFCSCYEPGGGGSINVDRLRKSKTYFAKSRLLQQEFRSIKVAYSSSTYVTKETFF